VEEEGKEGEEGEKGMRKGEEEVKDYIQLTRC
jgi:hypothetical protein